MLVAKPPSTWSNARGKRHSVSSTLVVSRRGGDEDLRRFTGAKRAEIWDWIAAVESIPSIAASFGGDPSAIRSLQLRTGGVRPPGRRRSERRLSLDEREEISRGLAAGRSLCSIAMLIGRAFSTVSREVKRYGGSHRDRVEHLCSQNVLTALGARGISERYAALRISAGTRVTGIPLS